MARIVAELGYRYVTYVYFDVETVVFLYYMPYLENNCSLFVIWSAELLFYFTIQEICMK